MGGGESCTTTRRSAGSVSRALVARAPTRLDFGGGWTDVPPYSVEQGGAVCNVAITRYATASVMMGVDDASLRAHGTASAGDHALVHAALRRSGVRGATASVASDFPIGAGLGGSSAASVALAGALAELGGAPLDCAALAERSRRTEVEELGIAGGFQDHYAAAFGGALLLTFSDCVAVEMLSLPPGTAAALARRALLLYTGQSRISSVTIDAVVDACRAGEPRVCNALARMKSLARGMATALRGGDVDTLGALVGEHWQHQRTLHPSITTPRIDEIEAVATRAGALGMKALGASGGGCVVVFARDGAEAELARALAALGDRLEYAIDETGFCVLGREARSGASSASRP
jgi:D-glycero-alpha-D-manno-heptose-7-phosphate kinase